MSETEKKKPIIPEGEINQSYAQPQLFGEKQGEEELEQKAKNLGAARVTSEPEPLGQEAESFYTSEADKLGKAKDVLRPTTKVVAPGAAKLGDAPTWQGLSLDYHGIDILKADMTFNEIERNKLIYKAANPRTPLSTEEFVKLGALTDFRLAFINANSEREIADLRKRRDDVLKTMSDYGQAKPELTDPKAILENQQMITLAGQAASLLVGALTGKAQAAGAGVVAAAKGGADAMRVAYETTKKDNAAVLKAFNDLQKSKLEDGMKTIREIDKDLSDAQKEKMKSFVSLFRIEETQRASKLKQQVSEANFYLDQEKANNKITETEWMAQKTINQAIYDRADREAFYADKAYDRYFKKSALLYKAEYNMNKIASNRTRKDAEKRGWMLPGKNAERIIHDLFAYNDDYYNNIVNGDPREVAKANKEVAPLIDSYLKIMHSNILSANNKDTPSRINALENTIQNLHSIINFAKHNSVGVHVTKGSPEAMANWQAYITKFAKKDKNGQYNITNTDVFTISGQDTEEFRMTPLSKKGRSVFLNSMLRFLDTAVGQLDELTGSTTRATLAIDRSVLTDEERSRSKSRMAMIILRDGQTLAKEDKKKMTKHHIMRAIANRKLSEEHAKDVLNEINLED